MKLITKLSFTDRHQVLEVINTRPRIWGSRTWDTKIESFYLRRSTYNKDMIFGMFIDGVLDCFFLIEPFDYNDKKAFVHGMVCTRKMPDREKYYNGYDINLTEVYNYTFEFLRNVGFIEHYTRTSNKFTPMYRNEHNSLSKMPMTIITILKPKEDLEDPILKTVIKTHSEEISIIRKFVYP